MKSLMSSFLFAVTLTSCTLDASADIYHSAASGNWIDPVTWGAAAYPGDGDTAYLTDDITVYMTNGEQVATVILNNSVGAGRAGGTLMLSKGAMLNVVNANAAGVLIGYALSQSGNLLISEGASFTNFNSAGAGYSSLTVKGTGSKVSVDNGVLMCLNGMIITANNAQVIVTNGGQVSATSLSVSLTNNLVYVAGGQSRWSIGNSYAKIQGTGSGVIVDDGAVMTNAGIQVYAGINNYLVITNKGVVVHCSSAVYDGLIGNSSGDTNNKVIVSGSESVWNLNGRHLKIAAGNVSTYWNGLSVNDGGKVHGINPATVYLGTGTSGYTNYIQLSGQGTLEADKITVGAVANTGNTLSNSGGVLQFTTATPTITINNKNSDLDLGNDIIIDSGTLSYNGLTSAALLNANQGGTGVGAFTWQGANTFRLRNSTETATTAYTFEDTADAKNYAGLELVDGTTSIAANPLTVAATGGTALFSNTTATVAGVFTNSGTMTVANSAVTFQSSAVMDAGCAIRISSTNLLPITVNGTLTVEGGAVTLPAGLGADDSFTLFTSFEPISGTYANMTLSSPKHRIKLGDDLKSLIVQPGYAGTMIKVQ